VSIKNAVELEAWEGLRPRIRSVEPTYGPVRLICVPPFRRDIVRGGELSSFQPT
jgi:hypothetical protein